MDGLFDRRLIFVTGKGGVGKSTVATALGLAAAEHGLRTVVAELAGQGRIPQAFGRSGEPFEEIELAPGLFSISIEPQLAMEEYLQVKAGALAGMLAQSRLFGAFAMATPGMRELLSIGKIWELAQLERRTRGAAPYDLVIVDAPATGHGVGILRTPQTFADIARVGPIAHQGAAIAHTIADPTFTAVLAVTSAEEMPVNETLAAADALAAEGLRLSAVVVNALYPERFSDEEVATLSTGSEADGDRLARGAQAAVIAAIAEHDRVRAQREQVDRLRGGLPDTELVELPYLFVPARGSEELGVLAERLAAAADSGTTVA
jgi:anion-transporting  ArsA/GET3 family ATPase